MADLDVQAREAAQALQVELLKEYREKRHQMTGPEKQTMLAEIATATRAAESTAAGSAYPFLGPTAIVGRSNADSVASLHDAAAPR